jgi:hypothetical protein
MTDRQQLREARAEVTHRCPLVDGGLMPCCGLTPFEVPCTDRITENPALVTCSLKLDCDPIVVAEPAGSAAFWAGRRD